MVNELLSAVSPFLGGGAPGSGSGGNPNPNPHPPSGEAAILLTSTGAVRTDSGGSPPIEPLTVEQQADLANLIYEPPVAPGIEEMRSHFDMSPRNENSNLPRRGAF